MEALLGIEFLIRAIEISGLSTEEELGITHPLVLAALEQRKPSPQPEGKPEGKTVKELWNEEASRPTNQDKRYELTETITVCEGKERKFSPGYVADMTNRFLKNTPNPS